MGKIRRLLHQIGHAISGLPDCRDVNGFLADYVDGNLDEKTRSRFERHMRRCPPCARFFDQYQGTIEMAREAVPVEVPKELADHTLAFLRQRRRPAGE